MLDDVREMAVDGAVSSEEKSNFCLGEVVRPFDLLVCLERAQMRLLYVRSDDGDGVQAGAG